MCEQLYDISFEFEYENGTSKKSLFFHNLSVKDLDALLLKFSLYGEVPNIKADEYENIKVGEDFVIDLLKPDTARLWFKIHYAFVKHEINEIVDSVNERLIQFIRESQSLEVFL